MCYQWSADPRRPNPLQNPQGWYRYWMTVLRSTYSRPIVCIVKDSEPKQHSQGVFQRLRTFRTGVYRDAQTIAKLYAQFKPIIEGSWAHKSPRERADILMQALIELAAPLGPEELWKYCPDITRSLLCGGTGEGFLRMMKHFVMSSISHTPSNFSVLSHPDVWSRFDFSSDDAERPKHVRTIHETVLVLRHAFITQVIMRMAYSLAGIQTKPMFTRQPRIRTLDRQTHQALQQPAFKDKNKQRKIFEAFADAGWAHYVDFCEHCGKSAPVNDSEHMHRCAGCFEVGRQVMYCSRECQDKDYEHGNPPHKSICSKILEEPIIGQADTAETSALTSLYTTNPSRDLLAQVFCLKQDSEADYVIFQPNGPEIKCMFSGILKETFLKARTKAMEEQDKVSVAIMRYVLGPASEQQLEREYQVVMVDCMKVAKGHPDWIAARNCIVHFVENVV